MDRKLLYRIAKGEERESDQNLFDKTVSSEIIKKTHPDFTKNVMRSLNYKTAYKSNFIQTWSVIVGLMVAIILWAIEGFTMPTVSIPINMFEFGSLDITNMTMYMMMANSLLVLLLIDRWIQYRKKITQH